MLNYKPSKLCDISEWIHVAKTTPVPSNAVVYILVANVIPAYMDDIYTPNPPPCVIIVYCKLTNLGIGLINKTKILY